MTAFGMVLRDRRRAARLSQIDLASAAKLNRVFISALETGRKEPGLRTLLKLARNVAASSGEMLERVQELVLPQSVRNRIARNTEAKVPLGSETCPKCKAGYALFARRLKRRERGRFKCPNCRTELASWLGTTEILFETERMPRFHRQSKAP